MASLSGISTISMGFSQFSTSTDNPMEESLTNILDDHDTILGAILANPQIASKLEYYLCDMVDIQGNPRQLHSQQDNMSFFTEIVELAKSHKSHTVYLQSRNDLFDFSEEKLFPFDSLMKEKTDLDPEQKRVLKAITSGQKLKPSRHDMETEPLEKIREIREGLDDKELAKFEELLQLASKQKAKLDVLSNGYTHFSSSFSPVLERIYVRAHKDTRLELGKILLAEFSNDPEICNIKFTNPQIAGRADNIVLYIGNSQNDSSQGEQKRDAVVKKLIDIQKQNPTLFSTTPCPFRHIVGTGIGTLPNLSRDKSFTDELANAIRASLDQKDSGSFKQKIIQQFLLNRRS